MRAPTPRGRPGVPPRRGSRPRSRRPPSCPDARQRMLSPVRSPTPEFTTSNRARPPNATIRLPWPIRLNPLPRLPLVAATAGWSARAFLVVLLPPRGHRETSATRARAICWACSGRPVARRRERPRPVPRARTPAVGRTSGSTLRPVAAAPVPDPSGGLRPRTCDELGRGGRRDVDPPASAGHRHLSATGLRARHRRGHLAAGDAGITRPGPGCSTATARSPPAPLEVPPLHGSSGCARGARSSRRSTRFISTPARFASLVKFSRFSAQD